MYKANKISKWEKVKRVVAHLFHLKTNLEIQEHFERLEWEENQKVLRLERHQHVRSLMIENADKIEKFNREKEERIKQEKIEEEKKRKLQEAIELYKSNRPFQDKIVYHEVSENTFEEVAVEETATATEE